MTTVTSESRPWVNAYQPGVHADVDCERFSSIGDLLIQSFERFKNNDSFHCMGKTLKFHEIQSLSLKFASYLQNELGLKEGDRIAIMMPNILQYPIALFGALQAKLVVVNVNPLYTERELEHQLNDSGAETIVLFANSAHILEKIRPNTKVKHVILTQIGDMLGFPKSLIVNSVIKYVKKMVPPFKIEDAHSFMEVLTKGDETKFKRPSIVLSDLAFLQYTGGTTGVAKGAELTHGNIVANMLQTKEWVKFNVEEGKEIIITPLPLYHIFSLTANCFLFCSLGALNVLITNPRDIPGFVKELSKWKFTFMTGVNTLFNALTNNPDFKKLDFSTLKTALGGGMAVQGPVAREWKKITGTALLEAYGLTETSPAACINPLHLTEYNGMIGIPISNTHVKVIDDDENEVPVGESGEIAIKGPQVMRGYWKRPDETAKVMSKDGFFKSGDIGVMDESGYFKIVDRKKDMILVSGFNVFPNEVEDVLVGHEKVLECAAVGAQDEHSGEVVKVFIVKKDASLSVEEVKAYAKENLTGYKRPKYVEFRDELPKTPVGKILRKELRGQ